MFYVLFDDLTIIFSAPDNWSKGALDHRAFFLKPKPANIAGLWCCPQGPHRSQPQYHNDTGRLAYQKNPLLMTKRQWHHCFRSLPLKSIFRRIARSQKHWYSDSPFGYPLVARLCFVHVWKSYVHLFSRGPKALFIFLAAQPPWSRSRWRSSESLAEKEAAFSDAPS